MQKIINGDCLEEMRRLEDKSVDLVLIDPPYNIGKDAWDNIDNYIEWMGRVFLEVERVLKENGSFYFFHNDFLQIVELQNYMNKNTKLLFKAIITIDKKDKVYVKELYGTKEHFRNYLNISEYCLFYTFQIDQPCLKKIQQYLKIEKHKSRLTNKDFNLMFSEFYNKIGCRDRSVIEHYFGECQWVMPTKEIYEEILQKTGYFQKPYNELRKEYNEERFTFNETSGEVDVWSFSFKEEKQYKHSTQKPIELIKKIIKASSNEGDLVLDCFGGSGTTAVACKELNRNYILIENNERYVDITNKRLSQTTSFHGKVKA